MDYRKMFHSQWFTASELDGGEETLTITKVTREMVKSETGEEERPTVHFAESDKPLVLNKTNARKIAGRFGNETDEWIDKQVTLRESVTTYRGEEVLCVRVK